MTITTRPGFRCITYGFFCSSRSRHTRCLSDWSSDVCSSDLEEDGGYRVCNSGGRCARKAGRSKDSAGRIRQLPAVACRRDSRRPPRQRIAAAVRVKPPRSEKRRGGERGRSRWSPDYLKKKKE